MKLISKLSIALLSTIAFEALAQEDAYRLVDDQMLLDPAPSDWLMINRTYDQQRFSPLEQINRGNVSQLSLAWARGLALGAQAVSTRP